MYSLEDKRSINRDFGIAFLQIMARWQSTAPKLMISEMRVLLVEDDPRIGHFVAKGLREKSYAVDVATSG